MRFTNLLLIFIFLLGLNANTKAQSECTFSVISSDNFESGWGIWNKGGIDSRRIKSKKNAWSPDYGIRLRNNSNQSVMTTNSMDLSNYEELTVEFYFKSVGFENGEEFWVQYGSEDTYTTVASYTAGTNFNNGNFYVTTVEVVIPGPFSSNSTLRFRCDASASDDKVYIDDVTISGCLTSAVSLQKNNTIAEQTIQYEIGAPVFDISLFPNPTRAQLNVTFTTAEATNMQLMVISNTGRVMQKLDVKADAGKQNTTIDASQMAPGMYVLHLITKDKIVAKKFIIAR